MGEWLVLESFSFDPDAGDPFEVAASREVLAAAPDDHERTEGIRWTLHPVDAGGRALRGWSADQDVFAVRLGQGWNRLLLRVANHTAAPTCWPRWPTMDVS